MLSHKKRYIVNFPGHLANCEFNYRRLRRLMPDWPLSHTASPNNTAANTGHQDIDKSWHYLVGSKSSDEMAITVYVTDCAKYTTTVHIAVQPKSSQSTSKQPYEKYRLNKIQDKPVSIQHTLKTYSLDVRLYHDAAVAEVVGCEGRRYFKARNEYPNRDMYHCDEKAQLNQFLGELLEFCLVQGRVMHDIVMVD